MTSPIYVIRHSRRQQLRTKLRLIFIWFVVFSRLNLLIMHGLSITVFSYQIYQARPETRRQASPFLRCFWSRLIILISKDTYMVLYIYQYGYIAFLFRVLCQLGAYLCIISNKSEIVMRKKSLIFIYHLKSEVNSWSHTSSYFTFLYGIRHWKQAGYHYFLFRCEFCTYNSTYIHSSNYHVGHYQSCH